MVGDLLQVAYGLAYPLPFYELVFPIIEYTSNGLAVPYGLTNTPGFG